MKNHRKNLLIVSLLVAFIVQAMGLSSAPVARAARILPTPDNPTVPHKAPLLGADVFFSGWPYPIIEALQDQTKGEEMVEAFRRVGLRSLRFGFHAIYSPRGVAATETVKKENKTTNQYPWFPLADYLNFAAQNEFTTVFGINVEEGPEVALEAVREFIQTASKKKLVAIELSNEPWLNHRPWQPEEYAERAAAVIAALTPLKVKFALPLTVGKDNNTPTKLSDNEWNRRMLTALGKRIDLKTRKDIYGVLHLYSDGVSRNAVQAFNKEVRPFAPHMRYLVTEYNIRLSLNDNVHLTNKYAMEFARKTAEVMAEPDIAALYVHAVPYHSILYWSNGKKVATVSGHSDKRLGKADLTKGWHLTPAGKVYALYSALAWNGYVMDYVAKGKQSFWVVNSEGGRLVVTMLNDSKSASNRKIKLAGREWSLTAPPHSIVCFDQDSRVIQSLSLPY